jgi:hypothetical protein
MSSMLRCLGNAVRYAARVSLVTVIVFGSLSSPASAQSCPSIAGRWDNTAVDGHEAHDLTPMVVVQEGCTFRSSFGGIAGTKHKVVGNVNGSITVTRSTLEGCVTVMKATLVRNGDRLNMQFSETNGTCNLPKSFPQLRVWQFVPGSAPQPQSAREVMTFTIAFIGAILP